MRKFLAGRFLLLLMDVAALQVAFFLIFMLRYQMDLLPAPDSSYLDLSLGDYILPSLVVTMCWLAIFFAFGFYRPKPVKALFNEITRVISAVSVGIMIFAFLLYSTDFPLEETRLVVFVYWIILLFLMISGRFIHFKYLQPEGLLTSEEYSANLASQKRLLLVALDLFFIIASYWGAFQLRFGGQVQPAEYDIFFNTVFMVVIVRFALFAYFKVYSGLYRYASIDDLIEIIKAVAIGSVLLIIPIFFIPIRSFPRSVLLIDSLLLIILSGGLRLAIRLGRELMPNFLRTGKRVLIIGAGDAGEMIVREMKRSRVLNYSPIGFIDDDVRKKGITIHGVPVLGDQTEIGEIVKKQMIEEIIIAIPSATNRQMRRIIENCRKLTISFKTVPPLKDIIGDQVYLHQVREIRVTDLLGREPVDLNIDLIAEFIQGKRVLVTGAAGSIGSEICRQILNFKPEKLVMIDRAENSLYDLQQELKDDTGAQKEFIVADVNNLSKMERIFEEYQPQILYHAAAFKQVPLMDVFPEEAVNNNIFGTRTVLELAIRYKLSHFILISTDKAVSPTSVMGASKKACELLAGSVAGNPFTRVIVVRFGNVLDTVGSVVPLFRKQIEIGGPVTVTDPRITRYFMTVSEATLLVLEASAVGKSGQLMVLKMGEPVKIVDLAKDMITLAGFVPNEDIDISFIGLRPGEKLEEELIIAEDNLVSSDHPKMLIAEPSHCDPDRLRDHLDQLSLLCQKLDRSGIITKLQEIIPNYTPTLALYIKNEEVKS